MSRERKSATDGPLPAGLGWRVLAVSCLVLLAGCLGERGLDNDPLAGGPPIPPPAPSSGPRGAAERPAETALPPLPPPYSATSPAALTGGGPQPPSGGQESRGPAPAPAPAEGPWKAPQGQVGAVLRQPEPVD